MSDDFDIIKQLGQDGAQGVVSLVEFPNGLRCAMKQFKTTKSPARIEAEANFQTQAADAGISPEVMHVDLENKRIFKNKKAFPRQTKAPAGKGHDFKNT